MHCQRQFWYTPSYHGLAIYSVQSLDWCCSEFALAWRAAPCMSEQLCGTSPCECELQIWTQCRQWRWCPLSLLQAQAFQTNIQSTKKKVNAMLQLFNNNSTLTTFQRKANANHEIGNITKLFATQMFKMHILFIQLSSTVRHSYTYMNDLWYKHVLG